MATENWSAAEIANRVSLEDFHSAFDVVFIDFTGYVNLCSDMSAAHYCLVLFAPLLSWAVLLVQNILTVMCVCTVVALL